jgi:tetratricopeptide (TPR) repeat protein
VAEQVVFRDAAGRQLTTRDLEGFTGQVGWEVIGAQNVPDRARLLHQQAREAGGYADYARALDLLDQARELAPDWPYPVYDAAFTYLLLGEPAKAEELYDLVDRMAPRGYFTCKASLDLLRRERAGDLPAGFAQAYAATEWMEPAQKRRVLEGVVEQFPDCALAWKDLAALLDDDDSRLRAIEQGLRGRPDPDTRGVLLINRASLFAGRGEVDAAVAVLGGLALSPQSTFATEHLAKAMLARLIGPA